LYTVRAALEWDLPAALAEVAAIGFREVEFAGYFGYSPRQIGNALSQSGLTAPSALVSVDELIEGWLPTVQAAAEIGHRWLVIAWLPEEMRSSLDAWRLTAELFNRAGDEATVYGGIRLAYHNRDFDFLPLEGRPPIA
jgi:sugar phosphate isomerase/epimerase